MLQERYVDEVQRFDYRSGIIISTICNMFGGEKAKNIEPGDFFGSLDKSGGKKGQQTPDDMLAIFKAISPKGTTPDGR